MAKIAEGRKAPDFTLADPEDRPVSLSDFKGKDVIVYFYPKDDTPGCTKEACGFRDLWRDLQNAGVTVLGVSADGPESHVRFAEKYRLPFTLLSDPGRKVTTAWAPTARRFFTERRRSASSARPCGWAPTAPFASTGLGWATPPSIPPRSSKRCAAGPEPREARRSGNMRHAG
jgi:peroxiredoxin